MTGIFSAHPCFYYYRTIRVGISLMRSQESFLSYINITGSQYSWNNINGSILLVFLFLLLEPTQWLVPCLLPTTICKNKNNSIGCWHISNRHYTLTGHETRSIRCCWTISYCPLNLQQFNHEHQSLTSVGDTAEICQWASKLNHILFHRPQYVIHNKTANNSRRFLSRIVSPVTFYFPVCRSLCSAVLYT